MSAATDAMARAVFGWGPREAKLEGKCLRCRKHVPIWEMSKEDIKEYTLSALCPDCWNVIFPPEDDA